MFDEHPYSVRFLTWGEPLLDEILTDTSAKGSDEPPRGLLLISSECTGMEAFYASSQEGHHETAFLGQMQDDVGLPCIPWHETHLQSARGAFIKAEGTILASYEANERSIHDKALAALRDKARLLFREAVRLKFEELNLLDGPKATPTISQAADSLISQGLPWRGLYSSGFEAGHRPVDLERDWPSAPIPQARRAQRLAALRNEAMLVLAKIRQNSTSLASRQRPEPSKPIETWFEILPGPDPGN